MVRQRTFTVSMFSALGKPIPAPKHPGTLACPIGTTENNPGGPDRLGGLPNPRARQARRQILRILPFRTWTLTARASNGGRNTTRPRPLNALATTNWGPNGQPLNDYAYASSKTCPSQNVITISAHRPDRNQPEPGAVSHSTLGTFRGDSCGFPLTGSP